MKNKNLNLSPLGKSTPYLATYSPHLLFAIPRSLKREELGIALSPPFSGFDIWNAYEISWLNAKGKPEVSIGEFTLTSDSPYIVESKSLKLYLNSFNQSHYSSFAEVQSIIKKDLSNACGSPVEVVLRPLSDYDQTCIGNFQGKCLDHLDIHIDTYIPSPSLLKTCNETTTETLYSHLLKSNCLVTHQPDWASVSITYSGPRIESESLLRYIISFRNHNEFHEQCIERIFMDISRECRPTALTVYGRYTRRGGLDINPFRSNVKNLTVKNLRMARQ